MILALGASTSLANNIYLHFSLITYTYLSSAYPGKPMDRFISAVMSGYRYLFPTQPSEAEDTPTRSASLDSQFEPSLLSEWTTHDSNIALYNCLLATTPDRPALPPEIILQILELPSRWICQSVASPPDTPESQALAVHVAAQGGGRTVTQVLLSFPPLSAETIRRLRRIEFTFTSKDQGWSSFRNDWGTYKNSWTWFEAGVRPTRSQVEMPTAVTEKQEDPSPRANDLERYDSQSENPYKRYILQRNRHAGKKLETYCIQIHYDDEVLQSLREGDALDLLACAQYPGWRNQVADYSIRLWLYDDLKEAGFDGLEKETGTFAPNSIN